MNYTPEQQRAFDEAARLFQAGDASRALHLLAQLRKALPADARVAYYAALCHERLGQIEEARRLCNALLAAGPNPKVQELHDRLDTNAGTASLMDDLLGPTARPAASPPKPTLASYIPERRQLLVTLSVLFAICAGFALNHNAALDFQQTEALRQNLKELPPPPAGVYAIMVAQWIVLGYLSAAVGVFLALYILDDLPGNDFISVIPGIATATAFLIPWLAVPVLGWIGVLFLISRRYSSSLGTIAKAALAFLVTTAGLLAASTGIVMGLTALLNNVLL